MGTFLGKGREAPIMQHVSLAAPVPGVVGG